MARSRSEVGNVIRDARLRAGLSQRELARRAGTAQSVVARIEDGSTNPRWATVAGLLAAAGFDIEVDVTVRPVTGSHMLEDVPRILALTPEARLEEAANFTRFISQARRA